MSRETDGRRKNWIKPTQLKDAMRNLKNVRVTVEQPKMNSLCHSIESPKVRCALFQSNKLLHNSRQVQSHNSSLDKESCNPRSDAVIQGKENDHSVLFATNTEHTDYRNLRHDYPIWKSKRPTSTTVEAYNNANESCNRRSNSPIRGAEKDNPVLPTTNGDHAEFCNPRHDYPIWRSSRHNSTSRSTKDVDGNDVINQHEASKGSSRILRSMQTRSLQVSQYQQRGESDADMFDE